jgi:hypothetical protein
MLEFPERMLPAPRRYFVRIASLVVSVSLLFLMTDIKRRRAGIQRRFAQVAHGGLKTVRLRDFSACLPD